MTQSPERHTVLRESQTFWKLVIVGCALLWGCSFTVMRDMTEVASPMWIIAIRFVPAAALMALPFVRRLGEPEVRGAIVAGAKLGVLMWAAYAFQVCGLPLTTASKCSFLCGIYCVIIPFVSWAMGRGRPRYRAFAAAVLCICGLALVTLDEGLSMGLGDLACIACAIIVAFHTVLLPEWGGGYDSRVVSASMFAVTGLVSLVWALAVDPLPGPEAFTPLSLGTWVYLSLACTLLGVSAMNEAYMHVDPVPGSLLSSTESPFGVIFAVLLGGEVLSTRLVCGFVIIGCAVVVSEAGDLILEWLRRLRGKVTT